MGWLYYEKMIKKLKIVSFSHRHILARVMDPRINTTWLFIGVYGKSEIGKNHITWDLLQALKPNDNTHWLVMGDCNEILYSSEKVSSRSRNEKQMQCFWKALVNCNLLNLGHSGDFFI